MGETMHEDPKEDARRWYESRRADLTHDAMGIVFWIAILALLVGGIVYAFKKAPTPMLVLSCLLCAYVLAVMAVRAFMHHRLKTEYAKRIMLK